MRRPDSAPPSPGSSDALPGDALVLKAAEDSPAGRRVGVRRFTPFLGIAILVIALNTVLLVLTFAGA